MIIVCPDCSKPYELPAQQISALVQIACPHCAHAVILDFEAANDPNLRETGHRVTSGFVSKADYLQSLSQPQQAPAANHAPVGQELRSEAPTPRKPLTQQPPAHPAPPQLPSTPQAPPPRAASSSSKEASGSGRTRKTPPPSARPDRMSSPLAARVRSSSNAGQRVDSQSAFPDLGPGFGGEAPEPPPMAEQNPSRGPRPSTMHFDLSKAGDPLGAPADATSASDSGLMGDSGPGLLPDTPPARPSKDTHPSPVSQAEVPGELEPVPSLDPKLGEGPAQPPAATDNAPGTSLSQLNEDDLAVASSGGGWIWWLIAAVLIAGGAFFGWSAMQSGHQDGADLLSEPETPAP